MALNLCELRSKGIKIVLFFKISQRLREASPTDLYNLRKLGARPPNPVFETIELY